MKRAALVITLLSLGCGRRSTASAALDLTVSGLAGDVPAEVHVQSRYGDVYVPSSRVFTYPEQTEITVRAGAVGEDDTLIRSALAPTLSPGPGPFTIDTGDLVSVDVHYTPLINGHRLWLSGSQLTALDASLLAAAGGPLTATVSDSAPVTAVAFDAGGNLWVSDSTARVLHRFPAAADPLGSDLTLPASAFGADAPGPLAFDGAGSLWVGAGARLLRFSADGLTATGAPAEVATLSGTVTALAFDDTGNLWLAVQGALVRVDVAHLTGSVTADLTVTFSNSHGQLPLETSLAFDTTGALWATSGSVVFRVDASILAASGTHTATPAVALDFGTTAHAQGLAFDESGGLWTMIHDGALVQLGSGQLKQGGTAIPLRSFSIPGLNGTATLATFPAPVLTPLASHLPE